MKTALLALTIFTCAASALLAPRMRESPEAALRSTVDALLLDLRQHGRQYRRDRASYYLMVDQIVVPRFDVAGIAQFALGKHARTATTEQRRQFADVLARTLVRSYALQMLDRFDSMALVWTPARTTAAGADRATINAVLTGAGERYPVGFSLRLVNGEWKIYDLEVEGVSLALNYRAQLGAEISRTSLDAVIDRMKAGDARPAAAQDP